MYKKIMEIIYGIASCISNMVRTTEVQHNIALERQRVVHAQMQMPEIRQETFYFLKNHNLPKCVNLDLPAASYIAMEMVTPTQFRLRFPLTVAGTIDTLLLIHDVPRIFNENLLVQQRQLYDIYGIQAQNMFPYIYRMKLIRAEQTDSSHIVMTIILK